MIAPGFGLARIPSLIRLYISLAVSLRVPVDSELGLSQSGSIATAALVAKEVLIGIVLGLSIRLLLLALETTAEFISHCVGLSNNFGAAVEGHEPTLSLISIVQLTAIALLFALDLHHSIINALMISYQTYPVGSTLQSDFSLREILAAVSSGFSVAIRLAFPIVVFSFCVNFAFGLLNRAIPQLPAYFLSIPVVTLGGLIVFHNSLAPGLILFMQEFSFKLSR